jgi:proliferating cell nuclear antigen
MKLMDIDSDQLGIPETEYDARVTLPSNEFSRIVRDLSLLGESVRIEVSKEGVRFASEGEAANGSILLRQTEGSISGGKIVALSKDGEDDGEVKEEDDEEENEDDDEDEEGSKKKKKSKGKKEKKVKKEDGDEDEEMGDVDEDGEEEQDEESEDEEESNGKKRKKKVSSLLWGSNSEGGC